MPVEIPLSASDADGNSLSLRIVSQPANGTVGLVGTVATFYPFDGFSGSDSFTYAAWDGSTNSNLGHGSVTVADTGGPTVHGQLLGDGGRDRRGGQPGLVLR